MTGPEKGEERVLVGIADGIAHVELNRPAKLNALDPALFAELAAAGARLATEPGLRAVVLSGRGRAFCAGLDLGSFAGALSEAAIETRTHGAANLFQEAALVWRHLPVPVVAALHGTVFGGGLQIALGADIRLVAPDARLAVMEVRWGLVPDMAGTLLLRDLVRGDVARELVFTGRILSGTEAAAIGLATRACDDPLAAAHALAREIAARSPGAIRGAKRLLNIADEGLAERVLVAESIEQAARIASPDPAEAMRAASENRAPRFRDPDRGAGEGDPP